MNRYDEQKPGDANRRDGTREQANKSRPGGAGDAGGQRQKVGDQGLRAPGASGQNRGQDESDKVEAEKSDQLDAQDGDKPKNV